MTTKRENMLRILRREKPDEIPLVGHCDPYNQPGREDMDADLAAALGKVRWGSDASIHFCNYFDMAHMESVFPPVKIRQRHMVLDTKTDDAETVQTWHTPRGDLRQVSRRCRDDGTSYAVEHFVKQPSDLALLMAVFEDAAVSFDEKAAERIRQKKKNIGNNGILVGGIDGLPLGMMCRVYCSVETLAYLYADVPGDLAALFAVMERHYQDVIRHGMMPEYDAFVGMDDTSTTVISPRMFEQYDIEHINQRAALCHAAGKFYFHHSCGLIRDLLPLYRQADMDLVHGFTIPPIGNVHIAEELAALGDRIAIYSGIACMAEVNWNPDKVRESVRRQYRDAGDSGRVIFGLAGYPHRNMAQTRFVIEECRKHGIPGKDSFKEQ